MKTAIINILNQCKSNKDYQETNKLELTLSQISKDDVTFHNIKYHSDYININLWSDAYNIITISFFDDNHIILSLSCGCDYRMFNDSDNIQYDEIKTILKDTSK